MKNLLQIIILSVLPALALNVSASEITPELRTVSNDSEFKPHVGFSAGLGTPEGDLNSGGNYALEIGYQPMIPLSLSVEYSLANYDNSGPTKLVRQSLLAKGAYNFGGSTPLIRYSYVGLGIGPMYEDTNIDDGWALGVLPNLGFDYPIDDLTDTPLSLGINTSYLVTSSDSPDVFAVSGVVKYWY